MVMKERLNKRKLTVEFSKKSEQLQLGIKDSLTTATGMLPLVASLVTLGVPGIYL